MSQLTAAGNFKLPSPEQSGTGDFRVFNVEDVFSGRLAKSHSTSALENFLLEFSALGESGFRRRRTSLPRQPARNKDAYHYCFFIMAREAEY